MKITPIKTELILVCTEQERDDFIEELQKVGGGFSLLMKISLTTEDFEHEEGVLKEIEFYLQEDGTVTTDI